MRTRLVAFFLIQWGILAGFPVSQAMAEVSAGHTIVIEGMKFTPETLTVKVGEKITWINKDIFPHTVTSVKAFDSNVIAAGGSWTYKAKKAGLFTYGCTLHPPMKATLTVQAK